VLERLTVHDFRNIASADLRLGPTLNLVVGSNAAGKTSLLEAVHCLGRARSFLPGSLDQLARRGSGGWGVYGEIQADDGSHRLGVGRGSGRTRVRLDGETAARLSHVAWLLPLQVLNTRSQRLLTEGPAGRRSFLNWGVFHVEPAFALAWQRYERALRQRNSALKAGDGRLAAAWEPELVAAAEWIDERRRVFLNALQPYWDDWISHWLSEEAAITWSYRRGWSSERALAEVLAEKRDQELDLGYGLVGPHRADLRFRAAGRDAGNELSRGQQKLLVTALRFALIGLVTDREPRVRPLLLIDDLPSELDESNQRAVIEGAAGVGAQVLVTAISREGVPIETNSPDAVFHVEQGAYREVL